MATAGGGGGYLAKQILAQIRARGLEPEPGELAQRLAEVRARRAALVRLGLRGNQRARILGIRAQAAQDSPGGNRAPYNRAVAVYASKTGKTYNAVRHDRTFQYWYQILREQENRLLAGKFVSRDPRGLYALALKKIGYRSVVHETFNVGGSPPSIP